LLFNQGTARSNSLSAVIEGKPLELMRGGRLFPEQLRAKGISTMDLETAARDAGLSGAQDATRPILEPNGRITVWPRG
jgi:uncharacterized membrane protein YcaP (DUF421 family)